MFSSLQKQKIASRVQKILRDTNHSELPEGEIQFQLHVDGAKDWSYADIKNNGAVLMDDPLSERVITSGSYYGPIKVLQGKRGLLLTEDQRNLLTTENRNSVVLVQWNNLDLWEEVMERTGQGWEKHLFCHFNDFYLGGFTDASND